jgi:hypothetical protein
LFDEVHGNGMPRPIGDRELLKKVVWLVVDEFATFACNTSLDIILDKGSESGPYIFLSHHGKCLGLSPMTSEFVIMFVK